MDFSLVLLKIRLMKLTKNDKRFMVISVILLALFFWLVATGCNTTKNIKRSSYDSLATKDDSIRFLKAERDLFEQQYNELLYASVLFDTITSHDTVTNTVTVTKEGEVRAEGKIKSVNISKNVYSSILSQKDKIIDSLRLVKEKIQVVTKTETKYKKVRFGIWWLLILIGYVLGIFYPIIKKS